jgi:hypothetical protein
MDAVCSLCKAKMMDGGGGPYREGSMPVEPLAPPVRAPWFTSERKALLKRAAFLLGISVVGATTITGGVFFIPKIMFTLAAGLGVIAALCVAFFPVCVFPHKLGIAVARKCKWYSWFRNHDITKNYNADNMGPVAWFVGILTLGIIPAVYGLGRLAIYLVSK